MPGVVSFLGAAEMEVVAAPSTLRIYSLSSSHFCACNFFLFNVSVCPFSVPSFSVHGGRTVGLGQLIGRDMNEPVSCHNPICCFSSHACPVFMLVNVCAKYKTSKSHRPLVMASRPTRQIPGFLVQLLSLLGLSRLNKMTETITV